MKVWKYVFVLMIILSQINYAQEKPKKIQVDFNEIKGELTAKDLYKKDFGRYDGYEIELFEGEAVNFVVYTQKFQPSLALVNSQGKIFKQSDRNNKGYGNIVTTITISGKYVLYVIGSENSLGNYILQTAIAEPNALSLDSTSDFCSTLDFLVAHSIAYFFLLENPNLATQQLVKLNDAVDAFIDEEDGSYNASFYNSNELQKAEIFFKTITDKIKLCVGKEWQMKSSNWLTIEDYKEKSVTFTENVKDKPRYIVVELYDYTGSNQKYKNNYSVEVKINRKAQKQNLK
ncbi:MAG: hypothetical protein NTZ27_03380 [Ignavibacteriales bacterium]|nr:hypothetical protein [Ignavibacteriales bacterium]